LLTGLALGVGWTPCATPALAVAMLAASHTESLGYAVALVVGHVLGVVAPLCAVVLGVTRIRVVRSALGRSGRAVQLTSGVLLVVQAVLVGTGLWERLAVQVMELTARV
jgi:cytochrome c-type biogenesis protein